MKQVRGWIGYHSDLYIDQYFPINESSYIDLPKVIKK
jgi:hypothetical protein